MEHILQVGINVDDDAIRDGIIKHAEDKIIKSIRQDVANKLFKNNSWERKNADPSKDDLSEFSQNIILGWLDSHKEEIISKAAEIISVKIMRSKKARDKIDEQV